MKRGGRGGVELLQVLLREASLGERFLCLDVKHAIAWRMEEGGGGGGGGGGRRRGRGQGQGGNQPIDVYHSSMGWLPH